MQKNEIELREDNDSNARLSVAILLAFGIVMAGFMAIVGLLYGFSRIIDKLNL